MKRSLPVWMVLLFLSALTSFSAEGALAPRIFQWRPFLAPFHAVVLHFPIGFMAAAFILEIYRWIRPSDELLRATRLIIWLSLFSGIVTAIFGIMRAETGGYESHAVKLHRIFGMSVPALTFLTLFAQQVYRRSPSSPWRYAYHPLFVTTLAILVMAGHFGGNLTHGSKYLVENAPEFVRELIETPEPATAVAGSNEKQRFYLEKVQPIFSAKCYQCHGEQKQKGGYRLDQPEHLLKGGESGKLAIKPFDPLESHLVRLILLPVDHDDVMPPSGKEPLTSDEIMTILNWIRDGAELPQGFVARADKR